MKVKITCTIEEYTELIRDCESSGYRDACRGCLFRSEECNGIETIAEFEIVGGENGNI